MSKLTLGIPKGSLEATTAEMFAKAGYKIKISSRSYYPTIDDQELSISIKTISCPFSDRDLANV